MKVDESVFITDGAMYKPYPVWSGYGFFIFQSERSSLHLFRDNIPLIFFYYVID